jgi:hypothetical protein
VFGHDDVPDDTKPVLKSSSFQSLFETRADLRGTEVLPAPKTTECDEVKIAAQLIAFQALRHERIVEGGSENVGDRSRVSRDATAPRSDYPEASLPP